ncbi:sensor histidine kinase [Paenibacillus hodogayensis]|uniref:Sensor histidine kinase n=1 Tax=Paenibacillus hodogayensis TaxID=279208 RepID=A0ABV5VTJ7_9BACL
MSLRFKLLMVLIVFLCMPFFIVLYIWMNSFSAEIERTAADYGKVLVKQTGGYIDTYFRDLEKDTAPLLVLPSVREFMGLQSPNDFDYYRLTNQIENEVSQGSLYRRGDIWSIDFIASKTIHYSSKIFASNANGVYDRALRQHKPDRTYGVAGIWVDQDGKPFFAYYRYYSDYVYRNTNNMIVLYLDLSSIDAISSNTLLRESAFLSIIDQDGTYIYHPDRKKIGTKSPSLTTEQEPIGEASERIEETPEGRKLTIRLHNDYTDWQLVYEVPLKSLYGQLRDMQTLSLIVMVCIVVLTLMILGGFAYLLTRRISHLQKLMGRAETGDMLVRAPERSKDELGRLNGSFNRMLGRIRELIDELNTSNAKERELHERQRETMIQAMQSQINPHFLYNTLEFINSYAILEGVKPISKMALSLSKMFRYSVNNNEPIVTLYEELEHVRWYCNIMQARSDSFEARFDIDVEAARSVACVRLALQPLVENAVLHGYERHGLELGAICLSGRRTEGGFELLIRDYGIGMDKVKRERLNDAFALSASVLTESQPYLPGVGMWNVHRRVRLLFGEGYGLQVVPCEGRGCAIRLTLPVMMTAKE